jgi:phosphate uptake regulator
MSSAKIVETRRVQRFGKSTLMVSLPAEWVKLVDLKPSDMVLMEVREDGSLLIIPQKLAERGARGREAKVIVSKGTNELLLQRIIYTLYVLGYDRIDIECNEGILPPSLISAIRTMVRMLIGSEIIEHTNNRMVIQIFVDVERYGVDNLVQRMVSIVKNMLDYLLLALKEGIVESLKEINELEYEMDRVHALAIRYIYVLSRMKEVPAYMEYRVLIRSLEDVGDILAQITGTLLENSELVNIMKGVFRERLEELKMHINYVLDIMIQSIEKENIYLSSRAADLAIEGLKFVSRLEIDSTKMLTSSEHYAVLKSIFERLMMLFHSLQAAAETVFDIVVSKKGSQLDITAMA